MRSMLWRIIYAVLSVLLFYWIMPLFAASVGFPIPGATWELVRACVAGIAVLYVLFGPTPAAPW